MGGEGRGGRRKSALLVIMRQASSIMDFIVPQRNLVLKNRVPLLQTNLVPMGASLGCDQLFKVPSGVIDIAYNMNLLSQMIIANNFNHPGWSLNCLELTDTTNSSLELMSLLFNTLSRFVIVFLSRRKRLLILQVQAPSAVILEPKKI